MDAKVKELPERGACHLYVISRLVNGQLSQPVKIGIAAKPVVRLRELQTGSPHKLVLVRAFRCEDREAALACERHLHRSWQRKRVEGEWFALDPVFVVVAAAVCLHKEITDFGGLWPLILRLVPKERLASTAA